MQRMLYIVSLYRSTKMILCCLMHVSLLFSSFVLICSLLVRCIFAPHPPGPEIGVFFDEVPGTAPGTLVAFTKKEWNQLIESRPLAEDTPVGREGGRSAKEEGDCVRVLVNNHLSIYSYVWVDICVIVWID